MALFKKVDFVEAWCYKVLPLVYDESLSYYEVLCKMTAALNELIENGNNLPEYIANLIEQFISSGAIDEVVRDILANYILNVKYPPKGITPAVGDGTADDTAAIQGCIDYANANGGMAVYFPSGKYLTQSLNMKSNVTLFGFDRNSTHLVLKGGSSNPLISGKVNNIELTGLTFDGNADIQVNNVDLIVLTGGDYYFNNLHLTDGFNLLTLNTNSNIDISNIVFGNAVISALVTNGSGLINANDIRFNSLSTLAGLYAIDNKVNSAVFKGIYSTVNTAVAIRNISNNSVFIGQILNAITTHTNSGSGNYYEFYNRDGTISELINDERIDRENADNALQSSIEEEATTRENADNALQSSIEEEATTRENADNALQSSIEAEATARENADNLLDEKINKSLIYRNVKDFGAVGDGITDDTNAFKLALKKGTTVFVPYTKEGYNLNTGEIVIPTECTLIGENKVRLISSSINLFIIRYWKSQIHNFTIDMNAASNGSTAIRFRTNESVINWTRISQINFIHCFSCIQDDITPTNYVVDLVVNDILAYYTRGTSITLHRTRGFITFRECKIDHTYNTYPVTWNSCVFNDLIGLELEKFDVVGPTSARTPSVYQNVLAIDIEGSGEGKASVWLTRVLVDNTMCNGIRIVNINYLVCNNIECFQNLGFNFLFYNVNNSQINNIFSFGPIGMVGFAEAANGISFENCKNIEMVNVKTMLNSGSGLLLNNCLNLMISNLTSIQNALFGVYEILTDNTVKNNVVINENTKGALSQTGVNSRYSNVIINGVLSAENIDGNTSR